MHLHFAEQRICIINSVNTACSRRLINMLSLPCHRHWITLHTAPGLCPQSATPTQETMAAPHALPWRNTPQNHWEFGTEEFNNSRYHHMDDHILKQLNTDQTGRVATHNQPSVNTTLLNESTKLHSLRHTCPRLERHRLITTMSFFVANDEQQRWPGFSY